MALRLPERCCRSRQKGKIDGTPTHRTIRRDYYAGCPGALSRGSIFGLDVGAAARRARRGTVPRIRGIQFPSTRLSGTPRSVVSATTNKPCAAGSIVSAASCLQIKVDKVWVLGWPWYTLAMVYNCVCPLGRCRNAAQRGSVCQPRATSVHPAMGQSACPGRISRFPSSSSCSCRPSGRWPQGGCRRTNSRLSPWIVPVSLPPAASRRSTTKLPI